MICCDGFISAVSFLFGCLSITSFSQNVGLVAMTKVVNQFTIATGAVIMIIAGIFPQIVQNVFATNCVAVVFLVAVILNLVLPENMENDA